jgi:hypothetical protein
MIIKIINLWNNYGWYIILFGSIFFLIILYFFNTDRNNNHISLRSIWNQIINGKVETKNLNKKSKVSSGEQKCKEFLEFVFEKPFIKVRPEFLKNPITNSHLELDCYNEDLKLAVEYNGKQHYEFNKMMHNNQKVNFHNQQYRDYIKQDLCKKNNINLIIVPYQVSIEDIPNFLYEELKKLNYDFKK